MSENISPKQLLVLPMQWRRVDVGQWESEAMGRSCTLRMNDFPEEPLYTVAVDGNELDLDDAPPQWQIEMP